MDVSVLQQPERAADTAQIVHDVARHGIEFHLTVFQFAEIEQLVNKSK